MKKVILVAILVFVLLSSTILMQACIFNDGSMDELVGIYGIDSSAYVTKQSLVSFGEKYEYYLLVIYKDFSAEIISKRIGEYENRYPVTITPYYDQNDSKKVSYILVDGARIPKLSAEDERGFIEIAEQDAKFTFYPMREDLKYGANQLLIGSSASKTTLLLSKLHERPSEFNIKRAIKKQTKTIAERVRTDSNDD